VRHVLGLRLMLRPALHSVLDDNDGALFFVSNELLMP
jgi:hypothetical protein